MKFKFILAGSIIASSFAFAQNASKVVSGKPDMFPEMIRFDASQAPNYSGRVVLYDENAKSIVVGNGKLLKSEKDDLGFETYKFQQTINGFPVEYGIQNVQVKNGKVFGSNGNWVKNFKPSENKKPNISESTALDNALAYIGAISYKWQDADEEEFIKNESSNKDATFRPKGELVYYADPSASLSKLALVYKFDVYASKPVSRQEIFVDAKSGAILGTNQLLHETNAPGTTVTGYSGSQPIVADQVSATSYRLRETGRNGGTAVETYNLKKGTSYSKAVDFTDTDNNWNNANTSLDQYATDAHWGAEKTLDYLKTKFNRNSINNAHFAIKSYVHYSRSYFNAFWDGSRMTYGDGSSLNGNKPLTALDVCAHEIGHGMTTFTANLAYQKESGALNEGFSDILGNSVELWARPSKASWKLGEDFNYVIRDMANPNAYSQPDTYGGTYWKAVNCTPSSTNDYCGVHTNSGVLNYWYYLLVNGGNGTNDKGFAFSVSGIGLDKAAQIAYRTLTTYLTSASTYANARTYSLQSATDLYGATSNEYTQTVNAWNAVGVGGGTSAAGKTAIDSAPAYQVASINNDEFAVNFKNATAETKIVKVISAMGREISTTTYYATEGNNKITVRVPSSANTGIYFVVINGEKAGSIIRK
jgi:bacillolysin